MCVLEGSLPDLLSLCFNSAASIQEVRLKTDNQMLPVALQCVPGNDFLSNGRAFQVGTNRACLRPVLFNLFINYLVDELEL